MSDDPSADFMDGWNAALTGLSTAGQAIHQALGNLKRGQYVSAPSRMTANQPTHYSSQQPAKSRIKMKTQLDPKDILIPKINSLPLLPTQIATRARARGTVPAPARATTPESGRTASPDLNPCLAALEAIQDQLSGKRRYWTSESDKPKHTNDSCARPGGCNRKKPEKVGCSSREFGTHGRQCRNWSHSHILCCNAPADKFIGSQMKWSCELMREGIHDFEWPETSSDEEGGETDPEGADQGGESAGQQAKAKGDKAKGDKVKGKAAASRPAQQRTQPKGKPQTQGAGGNKAGAGDRSASSSPSPPPAQVFCDSVTCNVRDVPLRIPGENGVAEDDEFALLRCSARALIDFGVQCRHQVHRRDICSSRGSKAKGWLCTRAGLRHDLRTDEEVAEDELAARTTPAEAAAAVVEAMKKGFEDAASSDSDSDEEALLVAPDDDPDGLYSQSVVTKVPDQLPPAKSTRASTSSLNQATKTAGKASKAPATATAVAAGSAGAARSVVGGADTSMGPPPLPLNRAGSKRASSEPAGEGEEDDGGEGSAKRRKLSK